MADKRRSPFKVLFGDDIGEMMEVMVGVPLAMVLFGLAPMLMVKGYAALTRPEKNADVEVLSKLPKDSQELVKELAVVQTKTQNLISRLEADAKSAENLVQTKRQVLDDLQRKIDLLKLTPEQRQVVEQYNRSVSSDLEFGAWISRKTTQYELAAALLSNAVFFSWGNRRGRRARPITNSGTRPEAEPE